MTRVSLLALLGITTAGLLGGCMRKTVSYDQPIQVRLQEISGEHPVYISLTVDGKEEWKGELGPLRKVIRVLHNPEPGAPRQLAPGAHKLKWEIWRNYPWGKAGNGAVEIYSGEQRLMTTHSKWIMPLFRWWWWMDLEIEAPGAGGGAAPPPAGNNATPPMGGSNVPKVGQ